MFTSEPSLAQRIERMISDTPVIDAGSNLLCEQPGATHLADLLGYPSVQNGLIAAGMPRADLDPKLPPDERVRRSIPYLKRMRNTSGAWCLFRIFRDLYDFDEPHLNEANYRDLFDKVAKTGNNPAWAHSVLQDRSKIRTVVTSVSHKSTDEARNPDSYYYRLNLDYLFCSGGKPYFQGVTRKYDYCRTIEAVLGDWPTSTEQLERLIFDWLDRTVTGRVRYSSTSLAIGQRFEPPDEAHAQSFLNQVSEDWEDPVTEVESLANFVSWSVLKWHHENKKAFQISIGTEHSREHGSSIPRFQETWTSEMARVFHNFSGVRFALSTGSDILAYEVALLAGQALNIYASGDGPANFFPMTIENNLSLRVQAAPMTKICGFHSDAFCVEWSYGKLQLVRKAMAATLARLVDARFFEEDEIPPLLQQILHDTPRDLYDLGER